MMSKVLAFLGAVLLSSGINMLLILIGSAIVPYPMARILRMQRR